nr:hypothetical protein CFP56_01123 [Quercus suber]
MIRTRDDLRPVTDMVRIEKRPGNILTKLDRYVSSYILRSHTRWRMLTMLKAGYTLYKWVRVAAHGCNIITPDP